MKCVYIFVNVMIHNITRISFMLNVSLARIKRLNGNSFFTVLLV